MLFKILAPERKIINPANDQYSPNTKQPYPHSFHQFVEKSKWTYKENKHQKIIVIIKKVTCSAVLMKMMRSAQNELDPNQANKNAKNCIQTTL